MQAEEKQTEINGIKTNYLESGSGNEKVVLIHGSGPGVSAQANWRLVMPRLSESLQVYAPDVVGFGKTDKVEPEKYTLDLWVEHLISFIEHVSEQPVYLVGNSFGGAMALHIAYRRPDLVKNIILMGSVGMKHKISYGLDRVWGYDPGVENMRELIQLFSYDQSAANNEELVEMRYKSSIEPKTKEAFHDMFYNNRQKRLDELALPDEEISKIETGALIFHGLNDQVIPIEDTSYRLIELLPHAEMHVFNECGHWTQIEKTDPFINHILAFIETA